MRRSWELTMTLAFVASACAGETRPAPVGVSSPDAPKSPATVRPSTQELPPQPESEPPTMPTANRVSDGSTFACGDQRCASGRETCCSIGTEGHCLTSSPKDGPSGSIGYLKTQWERCDKERFGAPGTFTAMAECDESIDCADGEICCSQFLFSGSEGLSACLPPKAGGSPCDYGELCVEDGSCRTQGTRCRKSICTKSNGEVPTVRGSVKPELMPYP